MSHSDELSLSHRSWVEEALKIRERKREKRWSERIAVGGLWFVKQIKTELGARGFGRNIISNMEGHELRESQLSYRGHFGAEKRQLNYGNSLLVRFYDVNAL